ncbi:probable carboxylesterase 2 [Benincasa hispida]|uniref:probable carboxylesterase 2 n=1 Tax=Benincasa hispida TaxID=102211 RepID=UPI0018FFC297|nr:probable carboxylesterase 2 [Benincasa hispida]
MAADSNNPELDLELLPYLRLYRNGVVERLLGTRITPPGLDTRTGVDSKDIIIVPETGVSARLYRPTAVDPHRKLPLVVYFHGGAFLVASSAEPIYHNNCLIPLAAEAQTVLLSVNYRLAPEHPLPAAYDDSWAALQWIAAQSQTSADEPGHEPWLKELVDFEKVFLVGDSAGGNISHHMALRAKSSNLGAKIKVVGIALIQPYFWGQEPIGSEITEHHKRAEVDRWWNFVCPSDRGNDDLLINPFSDGSPAIDGLTGEKVVVIVAEKDILRDRGKLYYENLAKSEWKGKVEIYETEGEDHAFHMLDPTSEKAKALIKRLAFFLNED